jgi:protein SCO1/2
MWPLFVALLIACGGESYVVEGIVVEVHSDNVVIDHREIPGFMGAMTMPFEVSDPALLADLKPGHRVLARLEIGDELGGKLTKIRVTGQGPAPEIVDDGPMPIRSGQSFPALSVPTHDGSSVSVGPDQTDALVVTFLYTRCPIPEACPAIVARMQALQEVLPAQSQILAITLDPEHDTVDLLRDYAGAVGAKDKTWKFGRLDRDALAQLALLSGLPVTREGDQILHGLRTLVIYRGGVLVERYDDNNWPLDRVVTQLSTGKPSAPPGISGTLTPSK